jgi:hypothetical protein
LKWGIVDLNARTRVKSKKIEATKRSWERWEVEKVGQEGAWPFHRE